MFKIKSTRINIFPAMLFILIALGFLPMLGSFNPIAVAQSTGDSLPTRTPTPRPTSTANPNSVRQVWAARLVSNTLGVTEGQGSIFRVSVQSIAGVPIELRSGDILITANSGSKPEYGPFAAEFAPVTEGTWLVSAPTLGASISVAADNYNLAVIEFVQIPEPEATRVVHPTVTPTPLYATNWQARLVSESAGGGVPFSRLLVQVTGLDNHPITLSTLAQVINKALTGQKPQELGPNTVEFTGLTPGKYIVEPQGLNISFEVELKPNIETRIEFSPAPAAPTHTTTAIPLYQVHKTSTLVPATATSTPTITPLPTDTATATASPSPTPTSAPQATPTPVTRWLGTIEQRTNSGNQASSITVKIVGIEGLQIRLISDTGQEYRCITGQNGQGQDICIFDNLQPGQYTLAPEGLGKKLPVTVYENEAVQASFGVEVLPPGITGWQARLNKNTNSSYAKPQFEGTIRVRLAGKNGQVVALYPARIPNAPKYCEVVYNPVLGGLICEFGQLGPGVYLVEALNTEAGLKIFVDGTGEAEIEIFPAAGYATQSPPQVGQGAQPEIPTPTVTPTSVPLVLIQPTATSTATPTPTPAFAWQGRIIESNSTGAGAIGVRAAGLKDHPVILRSGGWQSPSQLTGTKPELGEYAAEFGGLAPGEYIIELLDLAELKVTLQPGEFMLVEFRYDFVSPP